MALPPLGRSRTSGAGRSAASTPSAHSAAHPDDPCAMRTECWSRAAGRRASTCGCVSCTSSQRRSQRRRVRAGRRADVDGERHVAWDEATEREVAQPALPLASVAPHGSRSTFRPASERGGRADGERPARSCAAGGRCAASVEVSRRAARRRASPRDGADLQHEPVRRRRPRGGAAADVLLGAHRAARRATASSSRSPIRPTRCAPRPSAARTTALGRCWSASEGERHTMLSSPIILPDYPRDRAREPGRPVRRRPRSTRCCG